MWRAFAVTMLLVGLGSAARAWDISDLPPWLKAQLGPVEIDWGALQRECQPQPAEVVTGLGSLAAVRTSRYIPPAAARPAAPMQGLRPVSPAAEALPTVAVRPPGQRPMLAGSPLASVTLEARTESALRPVASPGVVEQLKPGMTAGYSLLLKLKSEFEQGCLDDAKLPQWLADQKVERATLVQALDQMTLAHPMDTIYLPICRVLWDGMGPDLEQYLEFPYKARIIMGIYLGVLEREEDAKKLLASVPEEWQKRDPSVPMYHVACELLDWRRKSPRLCVWAWKWGATMRGAADQAYVCWHVGQACRVSGDAALVRAELLPWCEEALNRVGGESRWGYALRELLWGYQFVGEEPRGVERLNFWLTRAPGRQVCEAALVWPRLGLADFYRKTGRIADAAAQLQLVAARQDADAWCANRARAGLLELAGKYPDAVTTDLPALFVEPGYREGLNLTDLDAGQRTSRVVMVYSYNPLALTATSDTACVEAEVGAHRVNREGLFERPLTCTVSPGGGADQTTISAKITLADGKTARLVLPLSARLRTGGADHGQ